MGSKSANWLLFLAVVILFSTGPLFWLTFSVFFSYPTEFGSNDSSQTLLDGAFRTNNEVQRQFELRREARRNGQCRNGWLNGFLCQEQIKGNKNVEPQKNVESAESKAVIDGIIDQSILLNEALPKTKTAAIHSTSPSKGRPLRIAQIAPLAESIPPKLYGGTERIVYFLTEELVRQGHHVTLFCSNDSQTSAQQHISHESWPALRLNPVEMDIIPQMWMMEQVRQRAEEFDILHFHTIDYFPMLHPFMERTVTTLHGLMSFKDYETLFKVYNNVPLVSISDDQRVHLDSADPNYVGTVHHGIPADMFPFNPHPSPSIAISENGTVKAARQPYLAFLGRITEVKRPEWAIEIAVRAGIPLKIAAKVDRVDVKFWKENVKPLVEKHADLVEYIGEITDSEKGEFLGNALALLFPIDWPEPFGLVMIESLACGTPVIARPHGSVAEVIEDGVSGLIFNTIEEGVEAAKRIHQLERAEVRKAFERRFTVEKMAENYVKVYEKLLYPEAEIENEKIEL